MDLENVESMVQDTPVQDNPVQEKPVPDGWEKRQCLSSGCFYYVNPLTKHWQWEHPGKQTAQQNMEMMKQFRQRMMHQLNEMKKEMDSMNKKMNENMRTLRGETQSMGLNLQAGTKGIMAIARDETRTAGEIMATPRAGTNELGGECNGC